MDNPDCDDTLRGISAKEYVNSFTDAICAAEELKLIGELLDGDELVLGSLLQRLAGCLTRDINMMNDHIEQKMRDASAPPSNSKTAPLTALPQ